MLGDVRSYLQCSRGTLIATLPPEDDGRGFTMLRDELLARLHEGEAQAAVLDASYVETIDRHEFEQWRQLVLMVEAMGSRCRVCGIRPTVAATLVGLDVDTSGIEGYASLDAALDATDARPGAAAPSAR